MEMEMAMEIGSFTWYSESVCQRSKYRKQMWKRTRKRQEPCLVQCLEEALKSQGFVGYGVKGFGGRECFRSYAD